MFQDIVAQIADNILATNYYFDKNPYADKYGARETYAEIVNCNGDHAFLYMGKDGKTMGYVMNGEGCTLPTAQAVDRISNLIR